MTIKEKKPDILIEKDTELTKEEKSLFFYFGVNSKIRPPFRILNPHRIFIGDNVSIREETYIHAYQDLSKLMKFINPKFQADFSIEQYLYDSKIIIGNETQIGRNLFISCTKYIEIENNVTISERIFIGDNNHSFTHPNVPIMQQPNKQGKPIKIGFGSWIGAGSSILGDTTLGKNTVVGTNSIVQGDFPDHAVIGNEKAKLLFVKKY
jgi:acetyltransferase-like isoleucine patch superfamily enzyme